MPEPTHFLNVDLDLTGRARDLEVLAAELDRRLLALHRDDRSARYELRREPASVDAAVRSLCLVLERLGPRARRAWGALRVRDLNVGLQAGPAPHAVEYPIGPPTITRIAELGARLVVTVYAPFPRPKRAATAGRRRHGGSTRRP